MLLSAIISSIFSMSALSRGATAPIPALLTSIVILESSLSFVSTFARFIVSLSSAPIGVMWRPLALARLAVSALRGASLRATRIRSYPRFARRSAYTAPMPLEAPVTRAVPFDVELLISFSPVSSRVSLHFIWIMIIIHSPTSIRIVGLWLQTFFGGPVRHSKAEKAKTHKRIVAIASRRFREEGLAGIGIADLMKEAGLTVGGFYKHFNSRDALVAEAVGCALELWKRQV